MKLLLICSVLLTSLSLFSETSVDKQSLAVMGYDVVTYFTEKKPSKGFAPFQALHEDSIYYFKNAENKNIFLKEPTKYAPQFGGWCAYAVADSSSKVGIDPNSYLVQDGRLLLFYNGFWGDTKKKWLNNKKINTAEYLKLADKNWPQTKDTKP